MQKIMGKIIFTILCGFFVYLNLCFENCAVVYGHIVIDVIMVEFAC